MRSILSLVVIVVFLTGIAHTEDTPMATLKVVVENVIEILKDPSLKGPERSKERRKAIRDAVERVFDFEEVSKRALGIHWRRRTPEERREFVALFSRLLEKTYISKIEAYTDEEIFYLEERVKDGYAIVKTLVKTSQGTEVPIYYRMLQKRGRWVVYDVVIEGVSLVRNYRSQFNKIIQRESYSGLLSLLRQKVAEE